MEISEETRAGMRLAQAPPGEEVCITGISGIFPESDNVHQLRDNLFNKKDLITNDTRRWDVVHPDIPPRSGKINLVEKFDSAFFGYHPKHANIMDPMGRALHEHAYAAITDAGLNPEELRGSNTGVFIGNCFAESDVFKATDTTTLGRENYYSNTRGTYATRLSHWLRLTGPSYCIDTACSSSLFALDHAYKNIRDGICDQAIVAGCNLCFIPKLTMEFYYLGITSPDGSCKSFDEEANGYVRSETVAVIFLQKSKDSKRVYSTVVHTKSNNDGYKDLGITYPSGQLQQQLLEQLYQECHVDPATVAYVEAHGTGTVVGDPEECNAIEAVFCMGRIKPLPVGSIKSNLGHTEPASGLCSIAKVIIAMETGHIPPNLHYKTPRKNIPALVSGKFQVVSELQPLDGGLVGINSFGFGGANCHVLLNNNPKTKVNGGAPEDKIPRLVTVSARTRQGLEHVLDDLASRPVDAELVRLYHDIHAMNIPGHLYRGYTILTPGRVTKDIMEFDKTQREVWLIFSGVDYRWNAGGVGKSLLQLPTFSEAIEKCQQVLKTKGIDIRSVITEDKIANAMQCCVATTAIQIGLVDVLKTIGIRPDGVIGFSSGEIAAGYADNCLTIEETILASYYHGVTLFEEIVTEGGMAKKSGVPKDVAKAGEKLNKCLKEQWTSSSIPGTQQSSDLAKYASSDYFANNLTSPVLSNDAMRRVPRNAILVEVSPSSFFKQLLRDADKNTVNIALTDDTQSGIEHLLSSLGRLYEAGIQLQLAKLYPEISLPVSRGTPMIAPLISWDHSRDYSTPHYNSHATSFCEKHITINCRDSENIFYTGHVIDGRNLFPATGYLVLVWKFVSQFSASLGTAGHDNFKNVVFQQVRFHRATHVPKIGRIDFTLTRQTASCNFEVVEGGVKVVSGRVFLPDDISKEMVNLDQSKKVEGTNDIQLSKRDIYKEFRLRGYNYSGLFRSITSATTNGERGKISWQNNWVAFLDNMLQMQLLCVDTRGLFVPTSIDKISMYVDKHMQLVNTLTEDSEGIDVCVCKDTRLIFSGGVEILGLNAMPINRKKPLGEPVIEKYLFLPNTNKSSTIKETKLSVPEIIRVCIHIGLENQSGIRVKAVELVDEETDKDKELLASLLVVILGDLPLIQADIAVLAAPDNALTADLNPVIRVEEKQLSEEEDCLFVLGTNIIGRPDVLAKALQCIGERGYIISRERVGQPPCQDETLQVVNEYCIGDETILMLKKMTVLTTPTVIPIEEASFEWVTVLQAALRKTPRQRILMVAQGEPTNGIIGLFNCIRREPCGDEARCFFIDDPQAPTFDLDLPLYKEQIGRDMALNVYKDGRWGSFRHLPLDDNEMIDVKHAYANTTVKGDLSSIRWLEGSINIKRHFDEELVHIYYSALNFRDVMLASGKLATEVVTTIRMHQGCVLGFEFSGRTAKGTRVMGMGSPKSMSNLTPGDSPLLWEIPNDWTLEDAATVPVVYGTAYFALMFTGRMKRGDSVLIHSGTGGVGQAAINLAIHTGCTVYTTVGTQEKRDFIKDMFPQLTDRHIGNSRDTSFEQLVMSETGGRGVDLVLNSLAEEKLQASVRCLAVGGRFLEIGKFDLANNNTLPMQSFLKETSFHGVMLDSLFLTGGKYKKPLLDILAYGIRSGAVRPLSRTVFAADEVEQAFRYMGAGKHIGKVLLQIRQEEKEHIIIPEELIMKAVPMFHCSPDNSYIIVGGLGGFGLELADWLVLRGARKLVLTSRTGIKTGYQKSRVDVWKSYGVAVEISTVDLSTEEGVTLLLNDASRLGPVAAIFNLAVVLADAIFENQTAESFITLAKSKSVATKHLDTISRQLCPELRHFVVFSSVSCGRGNAGQTNYGMANSVMERICEKRVSEGYPGLAIQWGAVGDVGLVADMIDEQVELVIGGTLQQGIASCLKLMDRFLRQPHPVVASMVVAEKKAGAGGASSMLECVANILGLIDVKTISFQSPLTDLGMDSMVGVEIKQTLERDYQVFLTPQEIRTLTLAKVVELQNKENYVNGTVTSSDGKEEMFKFLLHAVKDEDNASKPVVLLPSLINENGNISDILPNQPTLFLIPGIEGSSSVLETLALKLKFNVVCLQLNYWDDSEADTILKMASLLVLEIKSLLEPNASFFLAGYSFGGLLAQQLCLLLENEGHFGKLFLVDSSPDYMEGMTSYLVSKDGSDDNLQINLLFHLYENIPTSETGKMKLPDLAALTTWEERVELFLSVVPETEFSLEYRKSMANSFLRRIRAIFNFTWLETDQLTSKVMLLKPKHHLPHKDNDYGLSKYCKTPVDVHILEGTHITLINSSELANIMNDQI